MSEIFSKISSYNIINYIIPGGIFYFVLIYYSDGGWTTQGVFLDIFIIYFIGMTTSRVGSIIVEPLLYAIGFVCCEKYSDFVQASKRDEKINIFMETSSLYRTVATGFLFTTAYVFIRSFEESWSEVIKITGIPFVFSVLYLFSYKKQMNFVKKRVACSLAE